MNKLWEEAQPGEVWVIEAEGVESFAVFVVAELFGAVSFRTVTGRNVYMKNSTFTGFRKIWPESDRDRQHAFIAESSVAYPDVPPDEAARILNEIKESLEPRVRAEMSQQKWNVGAIHGHVPRKTFQGAVMYDDAIFRSLADGYPMHMMWKLSLPNMWDEIENTLGHPARFLTEDQREALR